MQYIATANRLAHIVDAVRVQETVDFKGREMVLVIADACCGKVVA